MALELTYGSVCSGIEAASVAWEPLGFKPLWFSEIEKFPSRVLQHHWPHVPNHGDMRKLPALIQLGLIPAPDVLVGGTPCQSFSIAGMRRGLADSRGNLTLTYIEIANAIDEERERDGKSPCITVWENVPGVLSSKDNAFGCFLAGLVGESDALQPPGRKWSNAGVVIGPQRAAAWRVLDAQYFGLAQRRKRVFVVSSARHDFDPGEVLLEFDGLRRDTPPSREARENATSGVGSSLAFGGWPADVASTLNAAFGKKLGLEDQHVNSGCPLFVPEPLAFSCKDYGADATVGLAPTLRAMGHGESHANAGGQLAVMCFDSKETNTLVNYDLAPTLTTNGDVGKCGGRLAVCVTGEITHALTAEGFDASEDGTGRGDPITTACAIQERAVAENPNAGPDGAGFKEGVAYTLEARGTTQSVAYHHRVRRLMPVECGRLQGFPDGHTDLGAGTADGPQYKAYGNSKAVPVVRRIGKRIRDAVAIADLL